MDQPDIPPLRTRHVQLERLDRVHEEALYGLSQEPEIAARWRANGATPNFSQFSQQLWENNLAQFAVVRPGDRHTAGLLQCYMANFRHGTAQVAIFIEPESQRAAWPIEGLLLFINYLFQSFPLRKLYGELPAFNLLSLNQRPGLFMVEEGLLRDHEWHWGRYWDTHIVSITRELFYSGNPANLLDSVLHREAGNS